jgi:hypothetical protein
MHARSPFGRSPRRRSPPTRWYHGVCLMADASDIREEDHLTSALTAAHRLARSTQVMRRRLLQHILSRLHAGRGIHSDPVAAGARIWPSLIGICRQQLTAEASLQKTRTLARQSRANRPSQRAPLRPNRSSMIFHEDLSKRRATGCQICRSRHLGRLIATLS